MKPQRAKPRERHPSWWHSHRSLIAPLLLLALYILSSSGSKAQQNTPLVLKLIVHDTIQPITAGYLDRGLTTAADQHATAVLISLGTPGGLLSSTRSMVAAIEHSPVPVILYISPAGSRAGSAGFFLLEAADIAAMAPGTNAGAAHPIIEGKTLDPILKEKVENDATAFLRSYVARRDRNVAAAEDAVLHSKSYSDAEALNLKLIDLIAPSDGTLLAALDGRPIKRFDGTSVTLHLTHATVLPFEPSLRERLLSRLTNPDLAVLLMVLGALLIYLEFNVPGTVVPGALGTLLLLLGVFGLDLLPIRHTAVLLLLAGIVLLLLETKFTSHGVLAVTGLASLVFGLATLVDGPIVELRVHLATALAAGIGFGAISFFLAWIAWKARRNKSLTGPDAMLGRPAVAITPLDPSGQVEIRGELWQASLLDRTAHLPAGTHVVVRQVDNLSLLVEASPTSPPSGRA